MAYENNNMPPGTSVPANPATSAQTPGDDLEGYWQRLIHGMSSGMGLGGTQNQLAQAYALQRPQANQYADTPGGAFFGSAANAVDRIRGMVQERRLLAQQKAMQDTLAQAMAESRRRDVENKPLSRQEIQAMILQTQPPTK
jgi:hypothetical protein